MYIKVKSAAVIPNKRRLRVYNLTVSGDHSYLVENVATFNSFPIHRVLANNYWRLYAKLDPDLGPGVDILSELPFGAFELTGEGVDGEVKERMDLAVEECNLRQALPDILRERFILGEAGVHTIWDDDEGIWTHVGFLNPDQLEVTGMPLVKHDPIVRYAPDARLREVLNSDLEQARVLRDSMPEEVLDIVLSGRPVEMSPVNFTFLARKQHPYDIRGTSIFTRAWRALCLEDSIWNCDMQVSRRIGAPLKVAMLGDPTTGWVPGPEKSQKLQEMILQTESDPGAWLVSDYALKFELVGVQERSVKVTNYADMLQRIKLGALGINKSILNSETAYAAAVTGLTIFLQKLKALREDIEGAWLIPKFFRQMAEMNMWIKPTEAELSHGVRTRRGATELADRTRYIVPKIEWERKLDPSVESAQIQALESLQRMGCKFSQQTMMAYVNRSYEEELKQIGREVTLQQEMITANPMLAQALMPTPEGGPGGGGGGGGGMMPGLPPEAMGFGDEGAPPDALPPGEEGAPPPGLEGAATQTAGPTKADDSNGPDTTKQAPQPMSLPGGSDGGWSEEQLMAFSSLAQGDVQTAAQTIPALGEFEERTEKGDFRTGVPVRGVL